MNFPNPFRNKREKLVEGIIRDAEEKVEREYGPIGKLGSAIIAAATNSRDHTKKYIIIADEKKRLEREVFLFYEHVYFFTHLSLRECFAGLSSDKLGKVHLYLEDMIPSVAIDSYFQHWPDDLKKRMTIEFIEKLQISENEYTEEIRQSSQSSSEGKLLGLFVFHASHIVQLCERESEWESLMLPLVDVSMNEWKKAQFQDCVLKIKQAN